jgi:glyoxylase-like metal-dependent hydrolase (beta-lactamase superfamily II)
MKIHAIQTGTVAIKSRQPEGLGHGKRRVLNTFIDREWTDPLPIYAFAIEHPEGVILVDTGETARTSEQDYFPAWHPFFRFGLREWVSPAEEIGPQLQRLGIAAADIRRVVLTHFHTDHAGGLHHFPHNEILASRADIATASGRAGRLRGYPNRRFPAWFDPTAVDLQERPFGPFPQSFPLTKACDVTLIPLPGHTPGQLGVVIEDGAETILLAGDASYSQDLMLRGAVDGVSPDEQVARETIARIHALVAERPTVYLVAHDPETPARLEARRVVGDLPVAVAA